MDERFIKLMLFSLLYLLFDCCRSIIALFIYYPDCHGFRGTGSDLFRNITIIVCQIIFNRRRCYKLTDVVLETKNT